jgi:hypothetical protein
LLADERGASEGVPLTADPLPEEAEQAEEGRQHGESLTSLVMVMRGVFQAEELKLATQIRGTVMPDLHVRPRREKARAVTEEESKFDAYRHVRRARADKRQRGVREKKAREAAEKV